MTRKIGFWRWLLNRIKKLPMVIFEHLRRAKNTPDSEFFIGLVGMVFSSFLLIPFGPLGMCLGWAVMSLMVLHAYYREHVN